MNGRNDLLGWPRDTRLPAEVDTTFADKWLTRGRYCSLRTEGDGVSKICGFHGVEMSAWSVTYVVKSELTKN
jgi:hypothetical protein